MVTALLAILTLQCGAFASLVEVESSCMMAGLCLLLILLLVQLDIVMFALIHLTHTFSVGIMQDLNPEPETITLPTKPASLPLLCLVILFFPFSPVSICAAFRQLWYHLLTEQYILDISGGLSCKFKQWENQWAPLLIHEKGCHCEKTVGRCGC